MASTRILGARGLWTAPSYLTAPVASFSEADNAVVESPGVLTCRRGFEELNRSPASVPAAVFSYRGALLVQTGSLLQYDTGVAFSSLSGTNAPPDPSVLRMQSCEAQQNFYYTTTEGVKVYDSLGGTPRVSGVQRGPVPTGRGAPTKKTGAPDAGWMPVDCKVAYVATWQITDANDTPHEGEPSSPVFVTNPKAIEKTSATGDITRVSNVVTYTSNPLTYPAATQDGTGFQIGDQIDVTYAGSDPNWTSGTVTLTEAFVGTSPDGDVLVLRWSSAGTDSSGPDATITTGAQDVAVAVNLPVFASTAYTLQVWRTRASVENVVDPRPQYYLDFEQAVTATDISNGFITYTDSRPDSLLGAALYTNTDDGEPPDSSLDNDDSRPPGATDLELFDGRMWGANYTELQALSLQLLGVGAPAGLQPGDTITVNGTTYTAVAAGSVLGDTDFEVFDAAQPAASGGAETVYGYYSFLPSERVALTAQSLVLTISNNWPNFIEAVYTSGSEDIPGEMLFRSQSLYGGPFTVSVSRASAWSPEFPVAGLSSSADTATNGLWFSKQNQPEAVPLLNRMNVGPKNARILRIQALRDKLYVFTDVAGIYTVSNTYPYSVDLLTKTAFLVSPDTLVPFDDAIYALTSQGAVKIDESGPQIISVPINDLIKSHFGVGLATLKTQAYAVGYESANNYLLFMPTEVADTYNTQILVYNSITNSWTRWTREENCGVVVPETDLLYVCAASTPRVSAERKNFDATDYSDESFTATIVSYDDLEVVVSDASEFTAGDLLYQDPITAAVVLAVDTDTNTLTMQETVVWTLGAATCYTGIDFRVVYTPLFSGAPEDVKHYREVQFHFGTPAFGLGKAVFYSDLNPEPVEQDFALGGYGQREWEEFAWEQPGGPKNSRVTAPTGSERVCYQSLGFALREARAVFRLMGYTAIYEGESERGPAK